ADLTHRDDVIALGNQGVHRVVHDLHRASERLEVPDNIHLADEIAGPRDHRVQVAHEAGVVCQLPKDERNIAATEGVENGLDLFRVLIHVHVLLLTVVRKNGTIYSGSAPRISRPPSSAAAISASISGGPGGSALLTWTTTPSTPPGLA